MTLPLFKIPFPDGTVSHTHIVDPFLFFFPGSWESVSGCFDILYSDSKRQRCKIIIKPDLSDASIHFINLNISEIISDDLKHFKLYRACEAYRICENAIVYFWNDVSPGRIYWIDICSFYQCLHAMEWTGRFLKPGSNIV